MGSDKKILKKKVDLTTFDYLQKNLKNPRYRNIARDIESTLTYV